MANEIVKTDTALSQWATWATTEVTNSFANAGVTFDEYNKECAVAAMTSIFQLVSTDKTNINDIDKSSIRESVGQAASLRLNANAYPAECYFQIRSVQKGNGWIKKVEMGIQGDGFNTLLRTFGQGVKDVYPEWIVHEGDDFKYPVHKGIEITPPEWTPAGKSNRIDKVVTIVKLDSGEVQYLISERESARTNLIAHIRNNMMNETFGICENRYKATQDQKKKIAEKKDAIFEVLRGCETVDQILACKEAQPYLSPAWKESPEAMISRKLSNNNAKRFKKNFDVLSKRSFTQLDDAVINSQEEIMENENSEDFEAAIEGTVISEEVIG